MMKQTKTLECTQLELGKWKGPESGRLAEKNVRRQFKLELGCRFRQRKCKRKDGVEMVWQEFNELITVAAES